MNKSGEKRAKALVIGGSIAGMLAARVLADHFREVVVIERDHYTTFPRSRSGVPQDRQLHILLLRGQDVLKRLFPRLEEHLLEEGALMHDYGMHSFYYYRGQFSTKKHLNGWLCSRVLLEWQVRQELRAYPQVRILEGYEVVGLVGTDSHDVQGVQIRLRNGHDDVEEQAADVVVDASGASSRAPEWLKALGYEEPEVVHVDASLGYATRSYQTPEKSLAWKFMVIQGMGGLRSGSLMQVEGRNVVVALAGAGGDYPDQTDDGYLAFAKSLPCPAFYETIKSLEPVTPIYGYRRTGNLLRYYERIIVPNNFLVLGDAFCSFNPVYGQGMTVAALEALALEESLRRRSGILSLQFHRRVARVVQMPWLLATAVDKSLVEKERSRSEHRGRSLPRWYLDRVTMLLSVDGYVSETFIMVQHMLRSPLAFLEPLVMSRVLFRRILE